MGRGQGASRKPLPIEAPDSSRRAALAVYWSARASLAELSSLVLVDLIAASGGCSMEELGDLIANLVQRPASGPLLFTFGSHRSLSDLVQSLVLMGWVQRTHRDEATPIFCLAPAGRVLLDTAPPDLASWLGLASD